MQPQCVAQTPQTRRIVRLADGTLLALAVDGPPNALDRVCAWTSRDHGLTWSEPQVLFTLDRSQGNWDTIEGLVDRHGELHVFMLHDRGTGVFGRRIDEGSEDKAHVRDACLDIWHARSTHQRTHWVPPQRIWQGYTGSLNSVDQLANGRIVLPFSRLTDRSWYNRCPGLDNFTYHGSFTSTVVYSDDDGRTWQQGDDDLKVWVPYIPGSYGSCEPVVLQRRDGRVWMLIRTQTGRLYESFSADGACWSTPTPTTITSSDSPAGITRLPDGRIVMLWNACLRYPYANGGRQVIHAAISEDEGATWIGCREAARDPRRHEPPPNGGDYGTAYPYPTSTADNHVIFSTGQGHGRIFVMRMNPQWLYQTRHASAFDDMEEWSTFGTLGVEQLAHPQHAGRKALRMVRHRDAPTAAVWNFPAGQRGTMKVIIGTEPGSNLPRIPLRLSLADHFSTPGDPEDAFFSLFNVNIDAASIDATTAGGAVSWRTITLMWDCVDKRTCDVRTDGLAATQTLPLLHHTFTGANYLRMVAGDASGHWGQGREASPWWVASVEVEIQR